MNPFYSDEVLALVDELGLVPSVLLTPTMLSLLDSELHSRIHVLRGNFEVLHGTPGSEGEVALDFLRMFVERYNRRGRKFDDSFYPHLTIDFSEK